MKHQTPNHYSLGSGCGKSSRILPQSDTSWSFTISLQAPRRLARAGIARPKASPATLTWVQGLRHCSILQILNLPEPCGSNLTTYIRHVRVLSIRTKSSWIILHTIEMQCSTPNPSSSTSADNDGTPCIKNPSQDFSDLRPTHVAIHLSSSRVPPLQGGRILALIFISLV